MRNVIILLARKGRAGALMSIKQAARSLRFAGCCLGLTLSGTLMAQWPEYKTPGAPRTPDGKVDLNAPTPKTADGKPDLSGIWAAARIPRGPGRGGRGGGAAANAGGGNAVIDACSPCELNWLDAGELMAIALAPDHSPTEEP